MIYNKNKYPHGWNIKFENSKCNLLFENVESDQKIELSFDSVKEIYSLLGDISEKLVWEGWETEG